MFTVEDHNRLRDHLVEMARADRRLVAGALIGSTTDARGDRWADMDLTFGIAGNANLLDVLADWTACLEGEFNAVRLFDLPHQSTMYRVFLFPGSLQVDLSFTPEAEFGALGPKFKLLFGSAVERSQPKPTSPQHLFGLAVHHLVRARICVERGRFWQAEYWIGEARNHALALACHHNGVQTSYGRGLDDLPGEILESFRESLVTELSRDQLLKALDRAVNRLLHNSQDVREVASKLDAQLRELGAESGLGR